MPELCRFFGIVIRMYHDDHPPVHFHAVYGDTEAKCSFDGSVLEGTLPRRQLRLVKAWARLHTDEVHACWERAQRHEDTGTIEPLR